MQVTLQNPPRMWPATHGPAAITHVQQVSGCPNCTTAEAVGSVHAHAWCRFLQAPRMRAKESRWWAWAPHISLQGGQVMPQEVCVGDAYIDKFIVSTGTATVDANSTRAFRARGILSVQGRCSDGRQLGYYGPLPSDTSVAYEQENIVVSIAAQQMMTSALHALRQCSCAVRTRQLYILCGQAVQEAMPGLAGRS